MSFWTAFLFVALAGVCCLRYILRTVTQKRKNLPPGPPTLPILGNLHLLGNLPHRDFHRLAKQYGSIMHLRLGRAQIMVVSSPQAAKQFLKTHDRVFASRPLTQSAKHMSYHRKDILFTEYGPYWRNMRKLCIVELLNNAKIDSFKFMRRAEVGLLVESLKDASKGRAAVDLSAKVASLGVDMTSLMLFGKKYKDENSGKQGLEALVKEFTALAAAFNLADYFPLVEVFDIQGLTRRMKSTMEILDNFFEMIIDEHMRDGKGMQQNFIDIMLSLEASNGIEFQFDRNNIKAMFLDMFIGGVDTSITTIEWTLSELLRHPEVMKKVQKELETVVGMHRMVEESDLPNLEYLDMVVKEIFRLHPVTPIFLPHEAMQDCEVNGFHIPQHSQVIINIFAVGRDPNEWPNAEEFSPERFMGTNTDVRGHDFQLLPFGSGRRGCPGMHLALTVVRFVVAQLVHCFDWELPDGMHPSDLDMSEKFSLVVLRAKPLFAIPHYRLGISQ